LKAKFASFLPTRNLIFILLCISGILGFFLLVIYPNQRRAESLDRKIEGVRIQIEEQKIFMPMYEQLRKMQRAAKESATDTLPLHKGKVAGAGDTHEIRAQIQQAAEGSRLAVVAIEPDVETIIGNTGKLRVSIVVAGGYSDLREFLVQLSRDLPSIEYTEHMEVRRLPDSQHYELLLDVWIVQG